MPFVVEVGRVPRADLFALARRLDESSRGVALLDGDGWGGFVLGCDPVDERRVDLAPDALTRTARALDEISRARSSGFFRAPRWIGYIAYESARREIERVGWTCGGGDERRAPPFGTGAVLRKFDAVVRRCARTGVTFVEGDDRAAVRRLVDEVRRARDASRPAPIELDLSPTDGDEEHRARVVAALDLIGRGDVYVVNVARCFAGRCDARATAMFEALVRRGLARHGAAIDCGDHLVASASPERFLETRGRRVITSPIKGTRPRGEDAASDHAQFQALSCDAKESAELTMVVDLERNDLGKIARVGSVRVLGEPRIETTRTVHHRVHDVVATMRDDVTLGELVRATLPSGSVTGAPKVRAMEIIATLEPTRRGIYCGAIVALDGADLIASMAIRSVVARDGEARYHAGGGIVAESDPDREVEETRWKARPILAAPRAHATFRERCLRHFRRRD